MLVARSLLRQAHRPILRPSAYGCLTHGSLRLKQTDSKSPPNAAEATTSSPSPSILEHPQVAQLRARAADFSTKASSVLSEARSHANSNRKAVWAGVGGVVLLGGLYFLSGDDGASDPMLGRPNPADVAALSRVPLSKLISGWIVYAFCSSPTLVEISEPLFMGLRKIPIISYFVDDFATRTFFRQFFGEETAEGAMKEVWTPLRKERVGVLTAYNTEAETYDSINSPEFIRESVDGTIESIEAVGAFGKANSSLFDVSNGDTRCWVRTKLSGLIADPKSVMRVAEYIVSKRKGNVHWPGVPEDGDFERMMNPEGVSAADKKAIHDMYDYLRQFMIAGQKYGVRIILDAEQSWYQPVVDVLGEQLMREFNAGDGPPIVCVSFQAYLRRNQAMIESQMKRAQEGGYKLVFKQVRGAYMPYERARWAQLGRTDPPPVWGSKAETDKSYDVGMRLAFEGIKKREKDSSAPDVAVIFATHNEISVQNATEYLAKMGMGVRQEDGSIVINEFTANRIAFAQIYGMKDGLTNRIASSIVVPSGLPVVCKSAPYGPLEYALPNLSRRAAENKTIMEGRGGAISERKRISREILRRYLPFYRSER